METHVSRIVTSWLRGVVCCILIAVGNASAQAGSAPRESSSRKAADRLSVSRLPSSLGLDAAASGLLQAERELVISRGYTQSPPDEYRIDQLHDEVQRRLLAGEALLLYQQTPNALQGWLITRDRRTPLEFRRDVQPASVAQAIEAWRTALTQGFNLASRAPSLRGVRSSVRPPDRSSPSASAAATRVAKLLLPQDPETWRSIQHVTIVPAGPMALVPWAALPLSDGRLLIEQVSVSIAPSLGQFLNLPQAWPGENRPHPVRREETVKGTSDTTYQLARWKALDYTLQSAVVVGDPAFADDPEWRFPKLPGALHEARLVGELLNEPVHSGTAASKKAVQDALRSRSKVDALYIATHAVASENDPLGGGFVALAGIDGQPPAASRWTAREIQAERIRADLVVLSACQTGMGRIHEAGIIGVGRAFYLAGVPQVLVSLWSVDDAATADLMGHFARQLATTRRYRFFPAEAVREAMLEARKIRPNPVFWASFATFGLPNVLWNELK
jgi:CHAT domain-containing protein